jgi:hypothetical protein
MSPCTASSFSDRVLQPRTIQLDSLLPAAKWTSREVVHSNPASHQLVARSLTSIQHGDDKLDLVGLEQLISPSQTRAIARSLAFLARRHGLVRFEDGVLLRELVSGLEKYWNEEGLDMRIAGDNRDWKDGTLARPRVIEVAMAINRLVSENALSAREFSLTNPWTLFRRGL